MAKKINSDYITAVRDEIVCEMARSRMTQAQLARRLKRSQACVSHRLLNPERMSLSDVVAMADALGVDLMQIGSRR